jgi:hypothetical protein
VHARTFFPLALTIVYAMFTFWPSAGSMPGWGGDPLFNLWTFEHVWRQMDRFGPLRLWSDEFWSAPIFAGAPLQLAFSENQLYPALLLRPLWHFLGGPLTLQWGAILMTLAAFGCAFGWLRSIGLTEMAGVGALLFACCGFVQSQYTHYQNLGIFLLPLALWSWSALEQRPGPAHAAWCALAFGWIGGWNMYFQIFADLVLLTLVLGRAQVALRWRAAAMVGAALVQSPIALQYAKLQRAVGSFALTLTYGATPLSVLGTSNRPTLLDRVVPFYPSIQVPVEAAGFLGLSWTALLIAALFRSRARRWAIAALLAFWAALGLGYGLFDVLRVVPGISLLRAAGRFQVLTALFAVPAALLVVREARSALRWAPLALALLELIPSRPALRVPVAIGFGRRATALDAAVAGRGPVLVVPSPDVYFQLYALPSGVRLLQGRSGRSPANVELVDSFFTDRPWTPDSFAQVLELTRPPLVVATDPRWTAELSSSVLLEAEGCFEQFDRAVCLFRARPVPEVPKLRLDRDAVWDYAETPAGWPLAHLRATRSGMVDYSALGRCRLVENTKLGPISWTRQLAFAGAALSAARLEAGALVLTRESRQAIFRLPRWARPVRTFEVRCG